MIEKSTLFIVNDIESALKDISGKLPVHSVRVVQNEQEGKTEFQLLQAQKAIKEAYIASATIKYIILCGDAFRVEAQNSLLKVLEEPPKNVIFLIFTISKNSILPTILSRVQVQYLKTKKAITPSTLNLQNLELKEVYEFLKQNQRISKAQAKEVVESILFSANQNRIKLTTSQLNSFSKSMKLLELNSRPINVLTTLLLTLITKNTKG